MLAAGNPLDGPAVVARQLSVTYGRTRALTTVELCLEWGERLALFGPNGAGKSTLLRTLAGLVRPSAGEVLVAGLSPRGAGVGARGLLGVIGHQTYLYDELTARENLRFYARLYRVSDLQRRVDEVLEQVGLYQRRDDLVGTLSRGMQQRLALARALVHDPPILLFDEPEAGLDMPSSTLLESLMTESNGRGRCVVFASHNLERGLQLATKVALLVGGRCTGPVPAGGLSLADLETLYQRNLLSSR